MSISAQFHFMYLPIGGEISKELASYKLASDELEIVETCFRHYRRLVWPAGQDPEFCFFRRSLIDTTTMEWFDLAIGPGTTPLEIISSLRQAHLEKTPPIRFHCCELAAECWIRQARAVIDHKRHGY